jgi:catechol 2,3-dioxygenase-like lactoylglutathione lyase family enzyme
LVLPPTTIRITSRPSRLVTIPSDPLWRVRICSLCQAIRVVDIERSLAFYGILGFVVSEKFFTPAGARACFVEGLGVRLELVESTTGAGVAGVQYWPGFLTFDVTKIAVSLDTWLDHLHRRNGGILTITAEPANQVVGSNVMSIATIEDPDGLPIDFVRIGSPISARLRMASGI